MEVLWEALATLQQLVGILQTNKTQPVHHKDWTLVTQTPLVVTTEVWPQGTMVLVQTAIEATWYRDDGSYHKSTGLVHNDLGVGRKLAAVCDSTNNLPSIMTDMDRYHDTRIQWAPELRYEHNGKTRSRQAQKRACNCNRHEGWQCSWFVLYISMDIINECQHDDSV